MLTATVLVLVRWWLVWQDEDGLEVQCVSWSAESAYSVSLRDLSRPLGLRKDTVPSCSDTKEERRDRKQRKGRRSEGAPVVLLLRPTPSRWVTLLPRLLPKSSPHPLP
jgi:hypothetical protein